MVMPATRWPSLTRPCLGGFRVVLAGLWLAAAAPATLARPPEQSWHAQALETRRLAENNAPIAHVQARQLFAALPKEAPANDRAQALNLLARIETYLGLTEEAGAHADQAQALATSHGDRIGQAEAHLNVALNAINQGRLDRMKQAVERSVEVLAGVDRPDLLGEAMLRTSTMYRRIEKFEESAAVAVQAMEIARRSQDPLVLTYAHQGLAMAYEQTDRTQESLHHYTQMRDRAHDARSRLLEGFAVAGIAGAQRKLGNLPLAETLHLEAIRIYREVGAPFSVSFGLYGLADALHREGRHGEALVLLDEAIGIYTRHPNRIGKWFALDLRSQCHEALRRGDAAWEDARQSLALAEGLGQALYMRGSAARLSALSASRGDYRLAYQYARQAEELAAQMARDKAGTRMVDLIQRYETESKQRAIEELTRRSDMQTAQLREREFRDRWLYTLLTSAILALAGAGWFMARLRRSHQHMAELNVQLRDSERHIRLLNEQLEERVEERANELRRRKYYLRTLLDVLPMWVWLKDTEGRYLVVNQALAHACGEQVRSMEGRLDVEALPPEMARRQRADDLEVMQTLQRLTREEPAPLQGAEGWIAIYQAPVLDDSGMVLGTVGLAQNISERKAAEAARDEAVVEAQRLARQRSNFLAQVSHELRTPLNGILGFAQLLQQDGLLTERQARGLRVIEESGQHLLMLINDILDLARIDAARLELQPSPVQLDTLLRSVCDVVRLKAEEKGLRFLEPQAVASGWTVKLDERRLRQVLLNLLSNAVKFSDRGDIALRVRVGADAAAKPVPGPTMIRLQFEVEDQGIGMTEAQRGRLFQAFEQVSDKRRRTAGTGLGLAISRELVRLMGGDISVTSQPGVGTCFSFEIEAPRWDVPATPPPAPARPGAYEGPRRTVLVVDDVESVRLFLQDLLDGLGFEVWQAMDGAQALSAIQTRHPDLVLMDMAMPVMDGPEALRRLRAQPATARLPVIALSADATPESPDRCLAAGADAFISKPIDQALLLQTMGRLLQLSWPLAAATEPAISTPANGPLPGGHGAVPAPPANEHTA